MASYAHYFLPVANKELIMPKGLEYLEKNIQFEIGSSPESHTLSIKCDITEEVLKDIIFLPQDKVYQIVGKAAIGALKTISEKP